MNNRNMSRELPQHLSPLSPLEIGTMIKQRVRRIEGPVSATIMVPNNKLNIDLGRDGPVIVLLYDYHEGNQRCDSCDVKDGCYSLYSPSSFLTMINDLSRDESISTDLFMEMWYSKSDREKYKNKKYSFKFGLHNSALNEMISSTVSCLTFTRERQLNCPVPNIRTHMGDTRKMVNAHTFIAIFERIHTMIGFMKDSFSLNEAIKKVKEIITKYYNVEPNTIFDLIDQYFHRKLNIIDVFTHPFYHNSRFKHEFNQLPFSIQEYLKKATTSIKNKYTDKFQLGDAEDGFNKFISILKDPSSINENYSWNVFEENVMSIHDALKFTKLDLLFVDIYTVSRLLKTFNGGLPSQLSVIYLGAMHTDNIVKMLSGYYEIIQKYGFTNYNNHDDTLMSNNKFMHFAKTKCINETNSTFRDVEKINKNKYSNDYSKGGKRYKKTINHNKKMSKQHKKMKILSHKAHKYNKKCKTQKKRLI